MGFFLIALQYKVLDGYRPSADRRCDHPFKTGCVSRICRETAVVSAFESNGDVFIHGKVSEKSQVPGFDGISIASGSISRLKRKIGCGSDSYRPVRACVDCVDLGLWRGFKIACIVLRTEL